MSRRPAIQQWAGHYTRNMGFAVVPLEPRSKRCLVPDWPRRDFVLDDFTEDSNIGLRSVNGLVVVDDDFPTNAVACMDHWLPRTGAVYGRVKKPRGKRLYRCSELTETVTFTDLDDTHLLQVRVGLQDMAPPSVHPDTLETLKWDGLLLPPLEVTREQLLRAVRLAWCSRLIAKYWPPRGRHDLRLAYARVLLESLNLPDDVAAEVLKWGCRLGGSDHKGIADARQAIDSTRKKLAANEPTKGATSVAELLPADAVGLRIVRLLRKAFDVGVLLLDPNDPMATARELVKRQRTAPDGLTLRYHRGLFYAYELSSGAYQEHDEATMRSETYNFLEHAYRPAAKEAGRLRFQPTKSKVENVVDALRAVCNLPATEEPPCWLKSPKIPLDPFDMLACPNGVLHIPTRTLYPSTPLFFTLNAIDFAYDAAAPPPAEWLTFLSSIWPDDEECCQTLQEIFGYMLTPDTRQQKIFMLVGPPRSGKGVSGRVLQRLLGNRNVCSPSFASFGRDFGKQVLIGKTLALIPDARISGRTDTAVVAETLLSISGEDAQTIERKFLGDWNGRLTVRFLLLTNELPRLVDVSGALAKRFVVLPLKNTFYGKEDIGLFDRLIPELPGILNWALVGRDRLIERGYFVQPKSGDDITQELADLSSPETTFLRECTRRDPGATVSQKDLFEAWSVWARENGREHVGTVQTFSRNVRAVLHWVAVKKIGGRDAQTRHWVGLRLEMPGAGDKPDWVPNKFSGM